MIGFNTEYVMLGPIREILGIHNARKEIDNLALFKEICNIIDNCYVKMLNFAKLF